MNQNQMIVAILIGFPLFLLILLLVMVPIMRRANTIVCPNCRERFPTSDITPEGVSCHHCNWQLVAEPLVHVEANSGGVGQ